MRRPQAAEVVNQAWLPPEHRASVDIHGVAIHKVDHDEVVDSIISAAKNGVGGWVATVNVDILRRVIADRALARLVGQADLTIADGMPLVWASRLLGDPLPERVAGSELLYSLSSAAAIQGLGVFLLGGAAGVADQAASALRTAEPDLRIVGTASPELRLDHIDIDADAIGRLLEGTEPAIVFCAFGFPKQEHLMTRLAHRFPRTWFLGIGGALTMASGITPAAPHWMRKSGLEWVHRLRLEPWRLCHRYLVDGAPFAVRLLAASALARGRATPPSWATGSRLGVRVGAAGAGELVGAAYVRHPVSPGYEVDPGDVVEPPALEPQGEARASAEAIRTVRGRRASVPAR
jgi:N-acetylglucosaminyldiphosphoundecaprenol N-acetyl-beta-D-mannosaminyltransferase